MGRSAIAPHGSAAAVLVLTALLQRPRPVHGTHGMPCCYEVACGRTDACIPNRGEVAHCAVEAADHEVRCCSDVFIGVTIGMGWVQNHVTCPWAASNAWAAGCIDGMTHAEAAAHCAAEGARLCTKVEIEADCTVYTGCTHDDELLWTSTEHATSCQNSLTHFELETDTRPSVQYNGDFVEVATEQLPSDCGDRSVRPPPNLIAPHLSQ